MNWLKRFYRILSSLGLGVTLLFLIALILAFATKFESSTSTHLVQAYVYRTFWFDVLLALFAVNLSLATWNLRPFRLRHLGVVTIHASILVILVGAWMTRHYGFEGTMTIDEGGSSDFISTQELVLTVYDPQKLDVPVAVLPTDLHTSPPQEFLDEEFPIPGGGTLVADRYYTDAQPKLTVKEDGPVENPGLHFVFKSSMFEEDGWLFPRRQGENTVDFNGMLQFQAVEFPDEAAWKASLASGGTGSLAFQLGGRRVELELPNVGGSVDAGGLSFTLVKLYRNFFMNEQGQAMDRPGPPANPALEFTLSKGSSSDRYLYFQNMPEFDPLLGAEPGLTRAEGFQWTPAFEGDGLGDKQVRFGLVGGQLRAAWLAGGQTVEQPVTVGGPALTLPWMGFQLAVDQTLRKAWRQEDMENTGVKGESPALRLRLENHGVVEQKWLRLGQRRPLEVGGKVWLVGFEQNRVPLGFSLTLKDFVEDKYPGSMMAAGYASFVVLDDPQQGVQGKEIEISMNNTLVHRGYKFFQSSFRRAGNMGGQETTILSVNNDPGHLVVYVGSLFLVLGLFTVFFLKKKLIDLERRQKAAA